MTTRSSNPKIIIVFINVGKFTELNKKITKKKTKKMKGHLIVIGSVVVGVALVLIVRDNLPKQSFSFKK